MTNRENEMSLETVNVTYDKGMTLIAWTPQRDVLSTPIVTHTGASMVKKKSVRRFNLTNTAPAGTGAASWLRVQALQQSIQGDRRG